MCGLVKIEIFDAGQRGRLLVVLLERLAFRPAVPKVPQQLSVAAELDDAVP
jgi:hypothetical protein